MLFMVIEHFEAGRVKDIYRRVRERGRMTPEGLTFVDSWIEAGFGRCFQLMECDDIALLQDWVLQWEDMARFEIVPVLPSKDVTALVQKHL
ncbi:MAG: DUF3303 domain-containing protein [Pseudorhodoplanes sp.]|uniref:DUF3303 domain-containing protein n=1 Tax=Pseudorhodoplanes sp. TaxID=1934341 RepID=UPI003D13D985